MGLKHVSSEPLPELADHEPEQWIRILTVHGEESMFQKSGAKLSGSTLKIGIVV